MSIPRSSPASAMVLGTAQQGMRYGIANTHGQPTPPEVARIVAGVWRRGVRFFDTAPSYGDAERLLGRAFAQNAIGGDARVISKLATDIDPAERGSVAASVKASLQHLGIARLWGLLLHREELLDQWDGALGVHLRELRETGLVARLGASVYSPQRALQALDLDGLDLLQVPANVFDRRMERIGVFRRAAELGKTVFIRSAYLQGLALMDPDAVPGHVRHARAAVAALCGFCRERGLDRNRFALEHVRQMAPQALVVVGAETEAQALENCSILHQEMPDRRHHQDWTQRWPDDLDALIDPRVWPAADAPRIVAIIQARMGSNRLPGKSLADIAGQPLLGHIIDRVRGSSHVTHVVVATTTDPADRAIAEFAARKGVECYRGSPDDVLDRYYQAARMAGADLVVRITADDPFKDPAIIDRVIARLAADPKLDYASNSIEPAFAEGLDVECFTFSALEAAWRGAALPSEREHVTPYLWKNPHRFRVASVTQDVDHSALRWTIDYPEDLQFAREVYSRLYRGKVFGADEVLVLLDKEPRLRDINAGRQRNAGYQASLQGDSVTAKSGRTVQRIGKRESDYVREVLEAQFRSSAGSLMTKRLEEAFASRFGCKYAVSFANGTATMHAALAAAGIGAGDEVIVPPLTMASTAFCVLHAGAMPVFADVHPGTWTIDPRSVEQRITSRTKAIIPVALYGLAPDLDPLMALAHKHGLFVLEDDAQCFLGRYRGRTVGAIGHAASFSFQSSKHMTSGEGGMVTTNDEALATRVRRLGSLGYGAVGGAAGQSKISREVIQDPNYLRHASIGWNYRISDLCSAVLLAQLERLDELVAVRVDAARAFSRALEGCDWLIPQSVPEGSEHVYWTFACRLADDLPFTWQQFRGQYLKEGGDPFYGAWALNYLEPALKGQRFASTQSQSFEPGLCPVAEKLQPRLLQFKTNYFDPARRELAAQALARTIAHFGASRRH